MLTVKQTGAGRLIRQVKALQQSPADRKRFMRSAGRTVVTTTRQRIKKQRTIRGQRFTPSADGKDRKLLKKHGRALRVRATPNSATVTWPNGLQARIASAHNEGITSHYTAARAAKEAKKRGEPDYSAPATAAQAKALLKEGFKLYRGKYRGGKKKGQARAQRVSQKWIRENMTIGKAMRILRQMRDEESETAWKVEVPARPTLGLEQNDTDKLMDKLTNETRERMKNAR